MSLHMRRSFVKALLWAPILGPLSACATAQETTWNGEYTSPNRIFSIAVPKPTNWAGVQYTVTVLDTKGDRQYDKVMFHVDDFGTYLVASARRMPAESVTLMDRDDHRTVLRNVSEAALMGWRTDLDQLPDIARESFIESQHGEAIVRVYRAGKGSILVRAQGRTPTRDDVFDTNIVCVVARQGALVAYVIGQDDSRPDDAGALTMMSVEVLRSMKILSGR